MTRSRLPAWLLLVAALGCSTASQQPDRVQQHARAELAETAPRGRGTAQAVADALDAPLVAGNQVEWLDNGDIFPALEKAVRGARQSIHVDIYIWQKCEQGESLARAIAERAKAGVACRILVDPAGSAGFDTHFGDILKPAGCEIRKSRDFGSGPPSELLLRNHRKIVVVDGREGFTGGFAIHKNWRGNGHEKDQWRDSNVRVAGPVVRQLQRAFAGDWEANGGAALPAEAFPALPAAGPARAALVASTAPADPDQLSEAERMLRAAIGAARKRLWIANSYFVPSDELVTLIAEKALAGVDVRVLMPGPELDWKTIRAAQLGTVGPLIRAGVKVFEYQPTMMHSKTVLVDDDVVLVGSTNMDPLSLKKLDEDSLVLRDAALARQQARSFERDLTYAKPLTEPPTGVQNTAARRFYWMVGKHL